MNDDPINNDSRKARRERRLGEGKSCSICGETDEAVLVLHWHHPAGRTNMDELRIRLCLNCHARHHATMSDEGVDLEHRTTVTIDRLPDILAGNGRYLVMLGELLVELAHRVARFLAAIDRSNPDWRQLPEANLD